MMIRIFSYKNKEKPGAMPAGGCPGVKKTKCGARI